MAEVTLRSGSPTPVDYTPTGGNLTAGTVVLLGNTAGVGLGVVIHDITNNTLGALDIRGGIYDVTMITNIAPWTKVYWDDTNNKVTSTSTNNAQFGYLVTGNTGANTVVRALLHPLQ